MTAIRPTSERLSLQVVDAFDPASVLVPQFHPSPKDTLGHLFRFAAAKVGHNARDLAFFAYPQKDSVGIPLSPSVAHHTLEYTGFRGACSVGVTTANLYQTHAAREQQKRAERSALFVRFVDAAGTELVPRKQVDRRLRLRELLKHHGFQTASPSGGEPFSRRQMFLRLWHLQLKGDVDLVVS